MRNKRKSSRMRAKRESARYSAVASFGAVCANDERGNQTCIICFRDFYGSRGADERTPAVVLSCGHAPYCYWCFTQEIHNGHYRCPECRRLVTELHAPVLTPEEQEQTNRAAHRDEEFNQQEREVYERWLTTLQGNALVRQTADQTADEFLENTNIQNWDLLSALLRETAQLGEERPLRVLRLILLQLGPMANFQLTLSDEDLLVEIGSNAMFSYYQVFIAIGAICGRYMGQFIESPSQIAKIEACMQIMNRAPNEDEAFRILHSDMEMSRHTIQESVRSSVRLIGTAEFVPDQEKGPVFARLWTCVYAGMRNAFILSR